MLAVSDDPLATGRSDAGVAVLEAFNYVTSRSNAADGLAFITDLFAACGPDAELTVCCWSTNAMSMELGFS